MAEWFIEGFLQRLLDETDTVGRALLDKVVIRVVPNMNQMAAFVVTCVPTVLA